MKMSLESWESPDLILRVRKMQCPDSKIVAACLCIFHLRTTLEHRPLHLTAKKRILPGISGKNPPASEVVRI